MGKRPEHEAREEEFSGRLPSGSRVMAGPTEEQMVGRLILLCSVALITTAVVSTTGTAQESPALAALQALRSATEGLLTSVEYRERLSKTKIATDRATRVGNEGGAAAISDAMRYYILARDVWDERLRHVGRLPDTIVERLEGDRCESLRTIRVQAEKAVVQSEDEEKANTRAWAERHRRSDDFLSLELSRIEQRHDDGVRRGIAAIAVGLVWACASEKITGAERLLAEPK